MDLMSDCVGSETIYPILYMHYTQMPCQSQDTLPSDYNRHILYALLSPLKHTRRTPPSALAK